jgi:hypothetical protein
VSVASFIASQRTDHGVPHASCCRWLGVSESWFYKWHDRPPTGRARRRADLDAAVKASFDDSGGNPGTYGSPRVWEDLVVASSVGTSVRSPHQRLGAGQGGAVYGRGRARRPRRGGDLP